MNLEKKTTNFFNLNPKAQVGIAGLGVFLLILAAILKPPTAVDIELAKLEAPTKIAALQQKLRHDELEKLSALEDRKSDRKLKCMAEITTGVTGTRFIIEHPNAFLELVAKTCP